MELRSPTETKNSKLPQWFLGLFIAVCLLPAFFFMCMDTYRTGDEIITYGMANEPEQGWMFSKGRVRAWLDTQILADGALQVPGHLISAAADVLQNRKGAAFFQMERPSESGWYTGEEMRDYLAITAGEAFRPGDIYLNGLGDDANSFLYYLCLHLLSSVFPGISAAKWSGFVLNLLCMAAALFLLYRIASCTVRERAACYVITAAYACSAAAVEMFTNIRPYALAVVFQEALLLLHLRMLTALREGGEPAAKGCLKRLVILYIPGYVSHYTTGIWAVCLALFTFCSVPKEKRFLRSYLLTGLLAVFLGICLDPMSVLGLLSKMKGSEGAGLGVAYVLMLKTWLQGICGSAIWLLPAAACGGIALMRYMQSEKKHFPREAVLFAALPVAYMLLSTLLMKSVKISTVLPYFFVIAALPAPYVRGERKGWKRLLFALCFLLWAGGMFSALIRGKRVERRDHLLLEEQLAGVDTDTLVFVRAHGAGYDKIPLLGSYERVYLLTTDEGWEERRDECLDAAARSSLVLFDGDEEARQQVSGWLAEEGLGMRQLFGNEQSTLIEIVR